MSLHGHPMVIRAPEARAMRDAAAIMAQARREALAEHARERQRGYDEGLHGAAATAARLVQDAALVIEAHRSERDQEVVTLALAIAHRILSGLPSDDVLAGIARTAIAEHRHDTRLAVRVSPDAAVALRLSLAASAATAHVEVEADPALPPGGCALSHPRGRTNIGLLDQFRAMLSTARDAG